MKRTGRTLGATILAAGLLVPAALLATSPVAAMAAEPDSSCEVTGGELTWGVKEGFRSYISGTIANGEWTTSDGASYETPSFTFSDPSGEIDATTGKGSASFTGTVNFTGHEGVLNLTLANPTIDFSGDGSARLLLDTKSNNADGDVAIDETRASVGKIGSIGDIDPSSGSVSFTDAETLLTADGAKAFSGFYSSGEELDPVSVDLELGACASGTASPEADDESSTATAPAEAEVPWLPIIIGAIALVIIVVAAVLLIVGRRKGGSDPEAAQPADESGEE